MIGCSLLMYMSQKPKHLNHRLDLTLQVSLDKYVITPNHIYIVTDSNSSKAIHKNKIHNIATVRQSQCLQLMAFNTLYFDGATPMRIAFSDRAAFVRWELHMSEIKQEASRIVTENPKPHHKSDDNARAIQKWLKKVDAFIETGTPVLPSILSARQTFIEVVIEVVSIR